jgi:cyclophilin family peptidyl-prolyl cis-trans isomerase
MDRDSKIPEDQRFIPGAEMLEERVVPAGNVSFSVAGGILRLTGDDAGNSISIVGFGKGATVLSADGVTTIGGHTSMQFNGIGGIAIKLGKTANSVTYSGEILKGGLRVDLGNGGDTFTMTHAGGDGGVLINGGKGDDNIQLNTVHDKWGYGISTKAGNDQVTLTNVSGGGLWLTNPSGIDFLNESGTSFGHREVTGIFGTGLKPTTNVAPSVTLSSSTPTTFNSGDVSFTAVFSEPVLNFSAAGISVSNGKISTFTQVDLVTYFFTVTPAGQGAVSATVNANAASDIFGNANTASNTVTRTFNTTAPTVTVNALTTNSTTPTLTGTVSEPGSTVTVAVNGQTLNAVVTGTTWAATVTTPLAQGTFPVVATATDPAGNVGTSAPANLMIDTMAPATPTLTLDSSDALANSDGLRTNKSSVTLTGNAEAGSTVKLFTQVAGSTPGSGTPIATITATSGGTYTFSSVALATGPNSFTVTATDAAGNVSMTFSQTFVLSAAPTATNVADQPVSLAGGATNFDLTNAFTDSKEIVQLTVATPNSATPVNVDVNLFNNVAPLTTTNFLKYVNAAGSAGYSGATVTRLDTLPSGAPFVLQAGGQQFNDTTHAFTAIPSMGTVTNEPHVSNTLGTIALARGAGVSSGSNEFFFNLGDNSNGGTTGPQLDTQNSGFTAFGQVMNGGLTALNTITNLGTGSNITTFNGSGLPAAGPIPVAKTANTTSFPSNINSSDLTTITAATELSQAQKMTFSLVGTGSSNTGVATVSITGSSLNITPVSVGTTTITVQATDLDGNVTVNTFNVVVGA